MCMQCMSVNLFCVPSSKKPLKLEYSLNFVFINLTFPKGEGNVVSYCFYRIVCVSLFPLLSHMHSTLVKSFSLRKWTVDSWVTSGVKISLNLFEDTTHA